MISAIEIGAVAMADTIQTSAPVSAEPPPRKGLPLQQWMALFDEHPIQVEDGEVTRVAANTLKHLLIAHRLYDDLSPWVKERNLGLVLLEAPYILDGDPRGNWVVGSKLPDVSFVTKDRVEAQLAMLGEDGPFFLAPDLAVEIISSSDTYTQINRKIAVYLRFGVRLIWVIDPVERAVRVFTQETPNGILLRETDVLTGDPVLPGWGMEIAALLGQQ
jgi:Uma2 family endonuclease